MGRIVDIYGLWRDFSVLNHVGLIRVLTSLGPPSPALLTSAVLPGWAKNPRNLFICFETKIISLNERRINGIYHSNLTAKLPEQVLVHSNGFCSFILYFERIYMANKSIS